MPTPLIDSLMKRSLTILLFLLCSTASAGTIDTDWYAKAELGLGANEALPGTDFWVNSGNFGVTTPTIDGETCKAITCGAAGGCQVYREVFHQSPFQFAYGTWEFWFSKAAATTFILHFISDDLAGTNGYSFQVSATEVVSLVENGVANLFTSVAGYVIADTWYKVRITRRQSDGQFAVYIREAGTPNEALVTAATGTNPVADNTVTTSEVIVLDCGLNDSLALGAPDGDKALTKKHGVCAP